MKIVLIAACGHQGAIGVKGKLPWHIPCDLKRFKTLTMGKICLMGRKTADGLPGALNGRINLVLTNDHTWEREGFIPLHSLEEVEQALKTVGVDELWVIGGQALYEHYIDIADVVYLTVIDQVVEDADAWFPVDRLEDFDEVRIWPSGVPGIDYWTFMSFRNYGVD